MYRWNYVFILPIFFFRYCLGFPSEFKKKTFLFLFTELKLNNHLIFTFYSSIQMNSPFSCYFLDLGISFPGLRSRMFYVLRKEIKRFFLSSFRKLKTMVSDSWAGAIMAYTYSIYIPNIYLSYMYLLKVGARVAQWVKKNHLLWNYWANLNQTLLKWSLGGLLPKLCPSAPSCIQDGHHY
jgi:hypothetical protein